MARDFDFRKNLRPVTTVSPTPIAAPSLVTAIPAKPAKKSKKGWIILIVFLVIVVIAIAVWQIMKPTPVVNEGSKSASTDTFETGSTETTGNIFGSNSTEFIVQIYNSGAGDEAVTTTISKLKALGYAVENLENSQFTYDQTQIWYREELKAEAEKIKSTLSNRQVTLKETKIAGSFDILILLGKK